MNGAFYIGATGLDAQQRALDVVANNIANVNTAAFKRSGIRFAELLMTPRTSDDVPIVPLDSSALMGGVSLAATPRVWTQGDLRQTTSPLDLAIDGAGFLEVMGPAGRTLLWRGGTLKVNEEGYLASPEGMTLKSMISVPQGTTTLVIAPDGTVTATGGDGADPQQIGRLDLVMVKDLDGLVQAGDGYYEASDQGSVESVEAGQDGSGVFRQGAIEQANVQLSDEMVMLLLLQRAYAASAQVVQAGDQLMSITNSLRR
jgi:flagellar basal-body rod protein FlgG